MGPNMTKKPRQAPGGITAYGWRGMRGLMLACTLAGLAGMAVPVLPVRADEGANEAVASGSGLPVPRFVSLKSGKVNLRRGPGTSYPVDWVFERRKMPVEIIAESDRWRKIRDREGDVGWVWHSMLDGRRSAIVAGATGDPPRAIRAKADETAPIVAYAEPGVIAELKKCAGPWCEVSADGYDGYMPRNQIWGTYPSEDFN